jgi:hypothetical protein
LTLVVPVGEGVFRLTSKVKLDKVPAMIVHPDGIIICGIITAS